MRCSVLFLVQSYLVSIMAEMVDPCPIRSYLYCENKKKKTTTEDCVTFRSQTVRKLTPIPSNVTTGCSGNYSLPLYRNYIIEQWVVDSLVKGRTVSDTASIHIYAFSRHFYPERLTLSLETLVQ